MTLSKRDFFDLGFGHRSRIGSGRPGAGRSAGRTRHWQRCRRFGRQTRIARRTLLGRTRGKHFGGMKIAEPLG